MINSRLSCDSSTDFDEIDFEKNCFICEKEWTEESGEVVRRLFMNNRILERINSLDDDVLLKKRFGIRPSLIDIGARFHDECYEELMSSPETIVSKKSKFSSKRDEATFSYVCDYLEHTQPKPALISDLKKVMGNNCIETRKLFRRLISKYGDNIIIDKCSGRESRVYFSSDPLSRMYNDWLSDEKSLNKNNKNFILQFAGEILFNDIKAKNYNTTHYNTPGNFFETVALDIPELLFNFLKALLQNKNRNPVDVRKIFNLGHSIISIVRPNSFLSHLHLAVGTYIHRKTGSKLIIEILSALGSCVPYHHIRLFEASAIMDPPTTIIEDTFVQFVFDNTDHNVQTIDGHRTFHCLGGIRIHTPEQGVTTIVGSSRKLNRMPSATEISSVNTIPDAILPGDYESGWGKIVYLDPDLMPLSDSVQLSNSYCVYLWAKHFKVSKIPSWKGFMEVMSRDTIINDISRIECLPFVNQKASDITTIYTSLVHAITETQKIGQKTCVVTYDQPLYKKAIEITKGLDLPAKIRLGGLHIIMAYLAAQCYLMRGSGLAELWGTVYAPHSVKHMFTGHAIVRGIRAHILTYTALASLICKEIELPEYKLYIETFLKDFGDNGPLMGDCNADGNIVFLSKKFIDKLNDLKNNGPTAKLWAQYFDSVTILLQFIEAERLGNWELHLQSIRKMLPLFHSTGHYLYAQCAHIYLQDMISLEVSMTEDEYRKFTEDGYFTIRRSDKSFSGIPSDMTIEQTLNRFFGTDLVHGRGVTESVVARYLGAMPSCFMIMEGLEEFCGITTSNSDQQVDLNNSRMKIDDKHLEKFVTWLMEHNPFTWRNSIVSLSTGVMGGPEVDCYKAFEKGKKAIKLMIDKRADRIRVTRSHMVKNLESSNVEMHLSVKNKDIDPTFLFKEISDCLKTDEIKREALKYELSPYPLTLFLKNGFMRQPDDKIFYSAVKRVTDVTKEFFKTLTLIVDGDFLVTNAVSSWPHGKTYGDICELYLEYLRQKYQDQFHAKELYVVFENYNNDICGVKSYDQYCNRKKNVSADFHLNLDALVTLSKKEFLSNTCNKLKFVLLLQTFLKDKVTIILGTDDTDLETVNVALKIKNQTRNPVAVISNNIDILILLITLTRAEERDMYFCKFISETRMEISRTVEYQDVRPFLLFVHTFGGCYSTSAIYNKGKSTILSSVKKDMGLQNIIKVFYNRDSSESDIRVATEKIFVSLYNGQSIQDIRYNRFITSSSSTEIEKRLATLPPTVSAAHEHGKRVYYQMQKWTGNFSLRPENWGWKRVQIILIPVMTTDPPASKELCQMVFILNFSKYIF